MRFFLV